MCDQRQIWARHPAAARGALNHFRSEPCMNFPISLTVNGVRRDIELEDPRVTLLDLLRERLDLTGTKKGCDRGERYAARAKVLPISGPSVSAGVIARLLAVSVWRTLPSIEPLSAVLVSAHAGISYWMTSTPKGTKGATSPSLKVSYSGAASGEKNRRSASARAASR